MRVRDVMSQVGGEGQEPLVTVSLVTFNGVHWLPGCLASLRAQTLTDYELLVIDNASTDGTVDQLRTEAARDARIRLIESPENLGFARAHNRNIAGARGQFVCLLNQDVGLDLDFLREAVRAFGGKPKMGAVQGRLCCLDDAGARTELLDTTGLEMQRDRRVISRDQGDEEGPGHLAPGPGIWRGWSRAGLPSRGASRCALTGKRRRLGGPR